MISCHYLAKDHWTPCKRQPCSRTLTGGVRIKEHKDAAYHDRGEFMIKMIYPPGRRGKSCPRWRLSSRAVQVWETPSPTLSAAGTFYCKYGHDSTTPAVQPSSRSCRDATVTFCDGIDGKPWHIIAGHSDTITPIAFSPDSAFTVTGTSQEDLTCYTSASVSEPSPKPPWDMKLISYSVVGLFAAMAFINVNAATAALIQQHQQNNPTTATSQRYTPTTHTHKLNCHGMSKSRKVV
ncbi:MAG: hypothetical protein J3R72DRAFT_509857 [Linnemannia gamsii]|nr:MAG: hypothetical protein J3R72DRAFT_509857 [Linnemannia gamsii]